MARLSEVKVLATRRAGLIGWHKVGWTDDELKKEMASKFASLV